MPTKPNPDARMLVTVKDERSHSDGYLVFSAEPCVETCVGGGLRFPLFNTYNGDPGHELTDLRVRAQLDGSCADGEFYGYRAEFQPYSVDLERAQSMVKTLRLIDKRMTALRDRFGYPQDLAGYMAHLVDSLSFDEPRCFLRRVSAEQNMSGTGYREMDTDGLRSWLAHEVNAWRIKHGFVAAEAA